MIIDLNSPKYKSSNWMVFLNLLTQKNIYQSKHQYYIKDVEYFIRSFPKRNLQDIPQADIESYIEQKVSTKIENWKKIQIIEALQILLV